MTPQSRTSNPRGAYNYHDGGPSTVMLHISVVAASWPNILVRQTVYPEAEFRNSALAEVLCQWENSLTSSQLSSDRLRPRLPSVTGNVGWIMEEVSTAQLHLSSNSCNLCGTSVQAWSAAKLPAWRMWLLQKICQHGLPSLRSPVDMAPIDMDAPELCLTNLRFFTRHDWVDQAVYSWYKCPVSISSQFR